MPQTPVLTPPPPRRLGRAGAGVAAGGGGLGRCQVAFQRIFEHVFQGYAQALSQYDQAVEERDCLTGEEASNVAKNSSFVFVCFNFLKKLSVKSG